MIGEASVLALIMARGGSKGLPGKNLREVGGRPLIAWTVDAARGARCVDRMVLSSDDNEIITVARSLGCEAPFVRPAALAQDDTAAIDVVRHAMVSLGARYDYLVLLQPTSPLRTAADIDGCVGLCHAKGAPCAVTVAPAKNPHWTYRIAADGLMEPAIAGPRPVRRQNVPDYHSLNGAAFVARWDWLEHHDDFVGPGTVAFVMPKERSVDVDDELDLATADWLIAARHGGARAS